MIHMDLIAAGRLKSGPFLELWQEYKTRLTPWTMTLIEVEGRNAAEEHRKIEEKIDPRAFLFVLDEKGKSLRSVEFAAKLDQLGAEGVNHIQFIIGGADGLSPDIRKRAKFLLSFGVQTWPHMMVRAMLIEQIYRARQILAGHPYHRES